MTQEEKAKAYDEAIERAKSKIKNDKDHVLYEYDILDIFPELKESEDERIRKEIISALKFANVKGVYDEHIAWLEKQGKQKPQRMVSAEAKEALYDKPAWSEEDEENLYLASKAIEREYSGQLFLDKKEVNKRVNTGRKLLDWLRSFEERIK